MNKRVDWKTIGQWVALTVVLVGTLIHLEHRLTTVETAISEQMKGYTIVFASLTARLDRIENRMERIAERSR